MIPGFVREFAGHLWEDQVLRRMRETFFDERWVRMPGTRPFFKLWETFFKLSQYDFFRQRLPEFNPAKSHMSWIPIHKKIGGMKEVALPEKVLDALIEKASHRVIVNFCGCRAASGCQNHPADIGCLMMGESALLIPEKSRREVSIVEAKAHVRKALESGLVPVAGKVRIDNDIFMLPDKGKLFTVCFCCHCCCITRFTRHLPPALLDQIHVPMDGLSIEVTDACVGCGKCASSCYLGAIEIREGRASIGELCRVCGRCASACPTKAIRLKVDNPHMAEDAIRRLSAVADL